MKRKNSVFIKMLVVFIVLVSTTMFAYAASAFYDTQATASSSDIEVSTNLLNKAKDNAKKYTDEFSNTATLSEAYDLHIYHFEAPKGGYYNFYTTGSTDTIIKVYEHKNFLWWTTRYDDLGKNDDGCKVANSINSSMVLELEKNEDYYICVRGWGTRKGQYTLHVEGNEDKIDYNLSHAKYSHWDRSGTSWNAAFQQALGAPGTYAKTYLTKDEVALFYWALTADYDIVDPKTGKVYNFDGLYKAYDESTAQAVSYFNTMLSLLTSIPGVPSSVGATVTIVGFIVDYTYDASTKTKEEMKDLLEEKCGAKITLEGSQYVNGKYYRLESISAKHGLCVENKFMSTTDFESGFTWTFNFDDYETYDSNIRVGVKYEKGDWSK